MPSQLGLSLFTPFAAARSEADRREQAVHSEAAKTDDILCAEHSSTQVPLHRPSIRWTTLTDAHTLDVACAAG